MYKTLRTCINCGTNYVPCRITQKYCSSKCSGEDRAKQHIKYFTCEICGKPFPDNNGQNRYCSYECAHSATTKVDVTCKHCSKVFKVNQYRLEHFNTQFCSKSCESAYSWVTLPCYACGKEVRMRKSRFRRRNRLNVDGHIFCSNECLGLWHREGNHPNWQGGHKSWRGANWYTQRDLARQRDNYTCQECGITEETLGQVLDVHHIMPWRRFNRDWQKANDLSNLMSLCPKCHTTIEARDHRRPPRTRTTQQAQI